MKIVFTIIILSFCISGYSQNNKPAGLKNYLKQCEQLLKSNGKWKSANKDYNAKDEWSASYFGYEFTRGINDNTLHLKITGYVPKKSEWFSFWNGYYTWDYKKQKVVYYSVNNMGSVATGESESITESDMSLVFTITSPKGQIEKHRDIQKVSNGSIVSSSFVQNKGKWEPKNSMIWTPLEQPTGKLIYMSTRDGNFEIYSMEANGDSVKNLSCNKASDYAFSTTPDGRIVFSSGRDGNEEIYIMSKDMKAATNLTNHPSGDRVAHVSPDGKWILFASYRDEENGELYLMDIDGRNVKRLTNNNNFEDPGCWSPDGKKIYFSRELKEKSDTGTNLIRNMEIFVMDVEGKNESRLTNKPGGDGGPMVSPDGSKIAFYGRTQEGNYEIFIMNADGTNIVNLSEDEMEDYSPSWSPDGKWIAYTKGNSKNYDVWVIHLETKIKYRLTTQPKRDESPFWLKAY